MKFKRIIIFLLSISLLLTIPLTALADGEGNMDGGGEAEEKPM